MPFVVPILTGICGFVAASIPPKGGATNTICKKSQPPRAESDPKDNFKMNQPRSLDNEGGLLLISNDTSILFFKTVTHR